jgi:phosphonate transport system substrate-binding protein
MVIRKGRSTYRSALIARASEGLSMAKLRGKNAVWVDRLSVGGYLLVVDHLRSHGIDPDQTFASQRFLGSHPAVLNALLHGSADVAAITVTGDDDAACREALAMHAGPAGKSLVAIALSDAAPTDALVLTQRLSLPETQRIIDRLFPQGAFRTRSFLCAAMECEGYVRAAPNEYRSVLRLLRDAEARASGGALSSKKVP